jgi:regulatory protein
MFQRNQKISGVGFKEVWDRAMKILEFRDHSIAELAFKLDQRFEQKELVEQVIKECIKHKYLDDDRFTEHYVEWLSKKGKSLFAIKQELKKKGIADNIIALHLNSMNDTDTAILIAEQKMKHLLLYTSEEQKKKLGMFLSNKGFSYDTIQKIFRHFNLNA